MQQRPQRFGDYIDCPLAHLFLILVAHNGKVYQLTFGGTGYAYLYLGTLGTAQAFYYTIVTYFNTRHGAIVYHYYFIASH